MRQRDLIGRRSLRLSLSPDGDVVAGDSRISGDRRGSLRRGADLRAAARCILLPARLPLLHAAGIATVLVHAQAALTGSFAFEVFRRRNVGRRLRGIAVRFDASAGRHRLAIMFLVDGFWSAWRSVGSAPARAAAWAGWGVLVPLVVLASLWVAFGNLDRDLGYAAAALVLTAVFIAGGEIIARREAPPQKGGLAVSFALIGAGVAAMLMLHMALGPLWTTMLAGALQSCRPLRHACAPIRCSAGFRSAQSWLCLAG